MPNPDPYTPVGGRKVHSRRSLFLTTPTKFLEPATPIRSRLRAASMPIQPRLPNSSSRKVIHNVQLEVPSSLVESCPQRAITANTPSRLPRYRGIKDLERGDVGTRPIHKVETESSPSPVQELETTPLDTTPREPPFPSSFELQVAASIPPNPKMEPPRTYRRTTYPQFRKPSPQALFDRLGSFLSSQRILAYLDLGDFCALHEREMMEREERQFRGPDWRPPLNLNVFGSPLRQVSMYASTAAVLGGYQHELPIILFACIEELHRIGFRDIQSLTSEIAYLCPTSNPQHRLDLQSIYDNGPKYGLDHSLEGERGEDICALLLKFLSDLPEPILGPKEISKGLTLLIWDLCVMRSPDKGVRQRPQDESDPLQSYFPAQGHLETPIRLVQHLLLLLPSPNFSMLVYILAFLSQISCGSTHGRDTITETANIFGHYIFGDPIRVKGCEDTPTRMLEWFLRMWGKIVNGLFSRQPDGEAALRSPITPSQKPIVTPCDSVVNFPMYAKAEEGIILERFPSCDSASSDSVSDVTRTTSSESSESSSSSRSGQSGYLSTCSGLGILERVVGQNVDCRALECPLRSYVAALETELKRVTTERDEARRVVDDIQGLVHN